jgi:ActR/RegA family two-component response regulator
MVSKPMAERRRILVVDDSESWLQTIRLILGGLYDLECTSDAGDAVARIGMGRFHLAILDQKLPGGPSGVELFIKLRELQPDLRAIVLTAHAAVDDAVYSIKSGLYDYISKTGADLRTELGSRVEQALQTAPTDVDISMLLKRDESEVLEFKSSARWDMRAARASHDIEAIIVKAVAGFLNADRGGVLLIGVDDERRAIGLEYDYRTFKKSGRDSFANFLRTLLLDAYEKDVSRLIEIDFHDINGKDICRVRIGPSPRPVFVKEGSNNEIFYLRTGNSTRALKPREFYEYSKVRWK